MKYDALAFVKKTSLEKIRQAAQEGMYTPVEPRGTNPVTASELRVLAKCPVLDRYEKRDQVDQVYSPDNGKEYGRFLHDRNNDAMQAHSGNEDLDNVLKALFWGSLFIVVLGGVNITPLLMIRGWPPQFAILGNMALILIPATIALIRRLVRRTEPNYARQLGNIVWVDHGGSPVGMRGHRYHVTAIPDAVIMRSALDVFPYEYKSFPNQPSPKHPRPEDIVQLMAQGLAVENNYGQYPKRAYLHYRGQKPMAIIMGPKAKAYIELIVELIVQGKQVPRQVAQSRHCGSCRYRDSCPTVAAATPAGA